MNRTKLWSFLNYNYNHLITIFNINLWILVYKNTSAKQYNCFIEQKLLFWTINKKEQITTNFYNTIHIFFPFWKITICWRHMNLRQQFSIMGLTDCKQNNIQLHYCHTRANRILEFHSSGSEMFLTALLSALHRS